MGLGGFQISILSVQVNMFVMCLLTDLRFDISLTLRNALISICHFRIT